MANPKENLRSGFTTGACATAAAKGALLALVYQRTFVDVTIRLPQGKGVTFALHSCSFDRAEGRASVIKDAGDDPDVTDKAEICCRVSWCAEPGITYRRGVGVGLVTKPGLPVPPGEPAINPVPRQMIAEALQHVLEDAVIEQRGLEVEIAVPAGEELAKKTFNPRLGIVGGISILGTSGIVVPYSTAAWVASVTQAIDVAAAQGCKHVVLTVGARGERSARKLYDLPEVAFVQIGPFFGAALRHCAAAGVERIALVGMIGKLAKFAAGNESVHSSVSRQDFEFLAQIARRAGADDSVLQHIAAANTAQEVADQISSRGLRQFFGLLCESAWRFAQSLAGSGRVIEVLLTGIDGEVLGGFP